MTRTDLAGIDTEFPAQETREMRLRERLERLERRLGPVCDYPTIVALDIPDGRLDTVVIDGEERAFTETLVQELRERGYLIQTVSGIDPWIVTGKTLVDESLPTFRLENTGEAPWGAEAD